MNAIVNKSFLYLIVLALLASCSGTGGGTVASVGGARISVKDLREQMKVDAMKYDDTYLSSQANFNEFRLQSLQKLIDETILLAEAKALGVKAKDDPARDTSGENASKVKLSEGTEKAEVKAWRKAQKKRGLIDALIEKEVIQKIPVTDEAVSSYYRKHINEFRKPAEYHARQILVDSRETADGILAELKKGADFAELAKKYSLSPDARRGGDLGYFDARLYPEAFAEICQKLSVGEVSEVQTTEYGYQIFELLKKRPPRQLSKDEVKSLIRRNLAEEVVGQKFGEWFTGLKEKYKVQVDEKVLKEVILEDNGK